MAQNLPMKHARPVPMDRLAVKLTVRNVLLTALLMISSSMGCERSMKLRVNFISTLPSPMEFVKQDTDTSGEHRRLIDAASNVPTRCTTMERLLVPAKHGACVLVQLARSTRWVQEKKMQNARTALRVSSIQTLMILSAEVGQTVQETLVDLFTVRQI